MAAWWLVGVLLAATGAVRLVADSPFPDATGVPVPVPTGTVVMFTVVGVAIWTVPIILLGRGLNRMRVGLTIVGVCLGVGLVIDVVQMLGRSAPHVATAATVMIVAGSLLTLIAVIIAIRLTFRRDVGPYFRRF